VNRLITFRPSHYCEKARWALDRAAIPYREEAHFPILSWLATYKSGARRTVPALVTSAGALPDSTDILRWVDAQGGAAPLFPDADSAALEDDFDARLGPATRRVAYFAILDDAPRLRALMGDAAPPWEARAGTALFPVIRAVIVRGLGIHAAGAARSRRVIAEVFGAVADRLADGRRYLTGDRFTAADLTFAALTYPVLWPDRAARLVGPFDELPGPMKALAAELRATPAGRFGMRMWAEERG
jgi:glutathione S-transferase